MIERHNPTLTSGSVPRDGLSAARILSTDRRAQRKSLIEENKGINRVALTRFFIVLFCLTVAYLVIGPAEQDGGWGIVNYLCPSVLCVSGLLTGLAIVVHNSRSIWTPLPWFMLIASFYYGVGSLFYLFADQGTIELSNTFWYVGPQELWRTNLLSTISLTVITGAFLIANRILGNGQGGDETVSTPSASDDDSAKSATFLFLCIGLPVRYLLVFPSATGQLSFVVPGIIKNLCSFVYVAIFMLSYLGSKRGGFWRHGFWSIFLFESLANSALFMKFDLLLVFVMAALGRYMARRNVKELAFAGLAIVLFYSTILSPLIAWSRIATAREHGNWSTAPIEARISVLSQGVGLLIRGDLSKEDVVEKDGWWGRICPSSAQAACMYFYDSGVVGDSFEYALYSWIPRLLWPDKPELKLGEQFTALVTGSDHNSTGAGVFGEAYWNGGWLMVVLACGYVGILFAWFSRMALMTLAHREWVFLPCAFIGVYDALRLDDWFAPTYITSTIMCLAYYTCLRFLVGFRKNQD